MTSGTPITRLKPPNGWKASAALRHTCQAAAGHHIILRPLKDIYAAGLNPELQAVAADVSLDDAEKPFAYQLTYSAPPPTQKSKPPEKQAYWEHLLANRPQPAAVWRRNAAALTRPAALPEILRGDDT